MISRITRHIEERVKRNAVGVDVYLAILKSYFSACLQQSKSFGERKQYVMYDIYRYQITPSEQWRSGTLDFYKVCYFGVGFYQEMSITDEPYCIDLDVVLCQIIIRGIKLSVRMIDNFGTSR